MANFPAGVIYIWTGTNATIPAGWERVTALDGKYPKGTANATNPNDTGGAATHEHTGTTHSHADSHTHNVTVNATSTGYSSATGAGSGAAARGHTHTATTGAVSGGGLSSVSCTYSAISNDPPYYTVIFITPSGASNYLPNESVYLYDGTDNKSGHYLCNGSNSTPNLVGKYLKGAGTGANAGTTGGSTTNVHNLTHTHSVASHDHADSSTSGPSTQGANDTSDNDTVSGSHTHTINVAAATATISATAPQLTTAETVEPAHTKLLTVQNRTGHGDARIGMIGMWLGTLDNIPSNYVLCDGNNDTQDMRGRHLKSTATSGDVGDTGGSNTHTHASQNHTHTAGATHTHSHGNLTHTGSVNDTGGSGVIACQDLETHTVTVENSTSVYANAATSGAESNNEPSYRTVAFIKLNRVGTAAMLLNLI
jgi:hypothetical protein